MLRIKNMYKIHGLRTAQGLRSGAGNSCFYETEEDAIHRATEYVHSGHSPDSMVIYKAHCIVRANRPPVEILAIEHDGEVFELNNRRK